jgi:hypothetical protein
MPPAKSKKFGAASFGTPNKPKLKDPEALARLMNEVEAAGGGIRGGTPQSDVAPKVEPAAPAPAVDAKPEQGRAGGAPAASKADEVPVASAPKERRLEMVPEAPAPVPTLQTGRSRGRGTKEDPRVRAKDGERLRQTSIHLPVGLHKRLRRYAFEQEVSLSTVMVQAIEEWLDANEG